MVGLFAFVGFRPAVAVAFVPCIEQVVDKQSEPDAFRCSRAECVAQIEIRHAIGIELHGGILVVGEILFADVLRVQDGFESAMMEVQQDRSDGLRRVGEPRRLSR